jgi:hypothetical protein
VKLEGAYGEQNPVREANDKAFKAGVVALFMTLASWCRGHGLVLNLQALGREIVLEPGTEAQCHAHKWQYVLEGELVVHPYRPRFPHDDCSMLPKVDCIIELDFYAYLFQDHFELIWGGAALQIASHCGGLRSLYLSNQELVRPDHMSYLRERRQGNVEPMMKLALI